MNKNKINFLYVSYFLFFLIPALLVWFSNPGSFPLYVLGKNLGLWGLTSLALQPFFASRFKPLEEGVGLDRIMRLHGFNAKFLFVSVLFHPVLVFSRELLSGIPYYYIISTYTIYHYMGVTAFVLIIMMLVTTLFSRALRINYEVWKVIHKTGYLIVGLGFAHSFFLGTDIAVRGPVFYWWVFLLIVAITGFVLRYFVARKKRI